MSNLQNIYLKKENFSKIKFELREISIGLVISNKSKKI